MSMLRRKLSWPHMPEVDEVGQYEAGESVGASVSTDVLLSSPLLHSAWARQGGTAARNLASIWTEYAESHVDDDARICRTRAWPQLTTRYFF